jgi:hypothetical protein
MNYGYFCDELYYIADGHHLQLGYVDHPLLIGWLAALLTKLTVLFFGLALVLALLVTPQRRHLRQHHAGRHPKVPVLRRL